MLLLSTAVAVEGFDRSHCNCCNLDELNSSLTQEALSCLLRHTELALDGCLGDLPDLFPEDGIPSEEVVILLAPLGVLAYALGPDFVKHACGTHLHSLSIVALSR